MPKYKFRLKAVEKVRAARRDQARAALAEAFHAEQVLVENQTAVAAEQAELLALQRTAASGENFDIGRLTEAQRYDAVLRSRQQELARQAGMLQVEIERRRRMLVETEREVRVMELLDKRHRLAHEREARRQEAKQLDEVATAMRARQSRGRSRV
jgi:flagellar export protein FliJ